MGLQGRMKAKSKKCSKFGIYFRTPFARNQLSPDLAAIMKGFDVTKDSAVDPKTERNVAHVFLEEDLEAAPEDDKRSGRPIDFDGLERSRNVAMVCTDQPKGNYRWTLDLIVAETHKSGLTANIIGSEQVRIILQDRDLKPWQAKVCSSKSRLALIKENEKRIRGLFKVER